MKKNIDNRRLQIDELLKREINNIFLREVDFSKGCLVTITKVITNNEITETEVYLSVLPKVFTGKVLSLLRKRAKHFVYLLKKRMTIKYIPEIKFRVDKADNLENKEDFVF